MPVDPRDTPTVALAGSAAAGDPFLAYLKERLAPDSVRLVYTDNTHTMLSAGHDDNGHEIRCHHMFRAAPREICEAVVAGYVRTRGRRRDEQNQARRRVREYIEANGKHIRTRVSRERALPGPAGLYIDLEPIAKDIDIRFFEDRLRFELSWTERATKRTLGKWFPPADWRAADAETGPRAGDPAPSGGAAGGEEQLLLPFAAGDGERTGARPREGPSAAPPSTLSRIVVNALLDHPDVPVFYLRYLLFHEMLHEHVYRLTGDANHGHRGLFNRLEAGHPDLNRARRWERDCLPELWRRHRIREGLARRKRRDRAG